MEPVYSSSAGTVVNPAGEKSIDVSTSALISKSLIFVTSDSTAEIGAKATKSNTFRIKLSQPDSTDLKVNWWIVN